VAGDTSTQPIQGLRAAAPMSSLCILKMPITALLDFATLGDVRQIGLVLSDHFALGSKGKTSHCCSNVSVVAFLKNFAS